MTYSSSKTSLCIGHGYRALAQQLITDGLVASESAFVRLLLAAATGLEPELMSSSYHPKALEIQRANPGMSYREACAVLGARAGKKKQAAAERERRERDKVARYQRELRARSGERDEEVRE